MRLATESIRLVSGTAEFCPARSRVQSPPEAPIRTSLGTQRILKHSRCCPHKPSFVHELVSRTDSNSIKISFLLTCLSDGHGDQEKSIHTAVDPRFRHRLRRNSSCSSISNHDTTASH